MTLKIGGIRLAIGLALAAALLLLVVVPGARASSAQTQALAVDVDGLGTVTANGINCREAGGDCLELYPTGTVVTLTATPDAGNTFSGWGGDCAGAATTCNVTMDTSRAVLASFTSGTNRVLTVSTAGNGTVTGTGINCGPNSSGDCTETYVNGTAVTLTATPSAGATFTGWGGSCAGNATTCNLTMDANKTVAATFSGGAATPTLSVTTSGNGTVTSNPAGINCGPNTSGDCSESYAQNTSVTLTSTPSAGATFTGWSGACAGAATTCTVTMDAAKSVTATYTGGAAGTQPLTVSVTGSGTVTGPGINCGNGQADCSESYSTNTTVALTATPAAGATFTGWGGSCSGNSTTCTVTMSAARSVTASFTTAPTSQTLTVSVSGSGRVTGPGISCGSGATDCSESFTTNTSVTLTATPDAGASFTGWGGSCAGSQTTCTVVMSAGRTVSAGFTISTTANRTLTVTISGSGKVTGPGINCGLGSTDCSETFANGTSVTLTAVRLTSAVFLGWAGSCSGTNGTCTITMDANKSVAANFSQSNGNNNGNNNTGGLQATFLGQPLISRTSVGWAVTLRFRVNQPAAALLRLSLGGRLVNAFTFSPRRGVVIVGPFHLGRAGLYRFALELNNSAGARANLIWNVCLSSNGCAPFRPASSFIRRGSANVVRANGGWVGRARFTPTRTVSATVTMYRGGRAVSRGTFSFAANRAVVLDVPTNARGTHLVRLVARDSAGRTTTVSWTVVVR